MWNASQVRTNRAAFSEASMSSVPANCEHGLHLGEGAVVDDCLDDLDHVVRHVRAVGDERVESLVVGRHLGQLFELEHRSLFEVVLRQVREQLTHVLDRVVLVGAHVVGDTRLGVVRLRATEVFERDVLTGDGLDDVGAGDEHVGGLVDHDDEIGDRGGVDGATGARAHDQGDLGDDARGHDVALEDLAVEAQGGDALLDTGATGVVDADDGAADLHREVHDLDDLLAEDLAQGSAEDGEVLREDAHGAAFDGAVAGDDSVTVGAVLLLTEVDGSVPREAVEFDEAVLVEELLDALAGGLLALGMLLFHGAGGSGVDRVVVAAAPVGEAAGCGAHVVAGLGARGGVGGVHGVTHIGSLALRLCLKAFSRLCSSTLFCNRPASGCGSTCWRPSTRPTRTPWPSRPPGGWWWPSSRTRGVAGTPGCGSPRPAPRCR